MIVENLSWLSISAMLFTSTNTFSMPLSQAAILQCQYENAISTPLRTTKSPTITTHLINLFD